MAILQERPLCWLQTWFALVICPGLQTNAEQPQGAYFLPEFALSPQGSFLEDTTGEQFLTYRFDDQTSRTARSDEDKDGGWDAWGTWSDCSRTCGGGASYSLRRCLNGRSCEGQNIRYKTCSNNDCPTDAGDFRAQQCSAYNDVKYQGQFYEWLPVPGDRAGSCALKCRARGKNVVVELAPKVLDGTRCHTDSLDMCISGICQAVGCDRQLGSGAKEDNCGVCAGDGSTCRLVRGQTKVHVPKDKREETVVIAVPLGSRSVRISVKGSAHLVIESKTLQGDKREHSFKAPGVFVIENTTVEFQKGPERETLKAAGPLAADFIFKTRYTAPRDSVIQFFFHQPISHQWRQTDFFPCTVTCGGGYQLNSAECLDIRLNRVVPDHNCHYHPENKKPKPKLKECGMDPCPSSDGFKEIMPYDHFQPLPRWEHNPWTTCSVSCGGGVQRRSFVCVEESMPGETLHVEEWKCMYAPKPKVLQTCNLFDCPKWVAMEWSQCTVTCGRGLRYRVVLCIDHQGQHVGGCNPQLKLHIKEECVVAVPCYKPKEKSPVEAKSPWTKQAQELEETQAASDDPAFLPEPWSPCSASCGPGVQVRAVRCRVLLAFSRTDTELPDEECDGPRPPGEQPCLLQACPGPSLPPRGQDSGAIYDWEYVGFTPCSATCAGGKQEAIATCLHIRSQRVVKAAMCEEATRPPAMFRTCNPDPCPPRWHTSPWRPCSATCAVGIQTREVRCLRAGDSPAPDDACPEDKPNVLKACNQLDCPPAWHVGEWQQCSVSCGSGIQKRKLICHRLTAGGQDAAVNGSLCDVLPRMPLLRMCRMAACPDEKQGSNAEPPAHPGTRLPQILGLHRIYIQTRREKRVHFTVGSRAYLRPQTSVVIKCPVRGFQKSLIRWEKDGRALKNSKRLWITKSGSLKVRSLQAGDIGVYRCIAGAAHETFVLKLIGADDRLIEPPGSGKPTPGSSGLVHNEADGLEAKWHQMNKMWHLWNEKNHLYLGDGQVSDQPSSRMSAPGGGDPPELGRPQGLGEVHRGAGALRGAHSLDQAQFAELVRNMSQIIETGEMSDDLASQVIYRLVAELSAPAMGGGPTEASSLPPPGVKATARGPSDRKGPHKPDSKNKGPDYPKSNQPLGISFDPTVSARIGDPVFITERTQTVNLLCEAGGSRDVKYTWTKNGAALRPSEKIILEGQKHLQIRNPTREEQGVYACMAVGELGSDPLTSSVLYAEAPIILSSWKPVTRLDGRPLSLVVGSSAEAAVGADITLQCPATGKPEPEVSWLKRGGSLNNNTIRLPDGALLLPNASRKHEGTYVCTAANAMGKAVAATRLRLSDPREPGPRKAAPGRDRKWVLMASSIGTNITVMAGELLRIGCPTQPHQRNTIRWFFKNRPLEEARGLKYRLLARGRILEVAALSQPFAGRYRCWPARASKPLSAWNPGGRRGNGPTAPSPVAAGGPASEDPGVCPPRAGKPTKPPATPSGSRRPAFSPATSRVAPSGTSIPSGESAPRWMSSPLWM
ncbi:ADAMTS-like protein 3 isoform X2 [Ornithorhynchus anatinus]|uniref:ADAMTS-like protein 3 isoform X2 n=1 Tax=Ornithorhynchus anatinus TaxID=9258 RepID=UPI0010A81BDC|nr:ADAMTS-like protein 3 isoform X2 [Ornithorhynchus anatinus]